MNVTTRPPKAVLIPTEAYTSEAYARAENEKLWQKCWQVACRLEELPKVGDFVTYDILDQSIIVVRTAADKLAAYHNVCQHRGRRLTTGCGNTKRFVCKFHAWSWNLDGENVDAWCREEWGDALTDENLKLPQVKVDSWGGWVFVNLDPNCEPLASFLEPAAEMLNPFNLDKMRYAWRKWLYFPCNWKIALEAFMEGYHVPGTHPQLTVMTGPRATWSKEYGKHGCFGSLTHNSADGANPYKNVSDVRQAAGEYTENMWNSLRAMTTQTIVNAAKRLVDELPADTPPEKVLMHMMISARKDDAARGVHWAAVDPKHMQDAGTGWSIFPNTMVLMGLSYALCYRARPHGYNPDSCIFEVYVLELFPEGQEPKTENIYEPEIAEEKWLRILMQDFGNMADMQLGMRSLGFKGPRPNPSQERVVINFHKTLSEYMGSGGPTPI